MPLALVFDVETTGLLPTSPADKIPHIIQLSYALYDIDRNIMIETYDAYVNPPEDAVISPLITNLTGITRELLDAQGIDISDAVTSFYKAYLKADILVAHNLNFDTAMIATSINASIYDTKNMFNKDVLKKLNKQVYCTMTEGTNLCKLERINSRGIYYKRPKLSELYMHLFGTEPENLHNSAVDVAACLRCFLKMRYDIDAL